MNESVQCFINLNITWAIALHSVGWGGLQSNWDLNIMKISFLPNNPLKCLNCELQQAGRILASSGSLSRLGRPRSDALKIPSSAKGLFHFATMAPNGAS